jgi:hypothetical protein
MGVEPTWDGLHPTNGFEDRGAHRNSRTPEFSLSGSTSFQGNSIDKRLPNQAKLFLPCIR